MSKTTDKRLSIDMDNVRHSHIKKVSVDKNYSMRKWIMEAIDEKIIRDLELGFNHGKKDKIV